MNTAALLVTFVCSLAALAPSPREDDRAADRAAIRADIETIYQAFIAKDVEKVRVTHDPAWIGFLPGSREVIRGIDEYMRAVQPGLRSAYGMTAFKIRDLEISFSGDAALVTFVTDVDLKTTSGPGHSVQRLADFYVKKNGKWTQCGSNTSVSPEAVADQMSQLQQLSPQARTALLDAREAVWRAYFGNDQAALGKLLPPELIVVPPQGDRFGTRSSVMEQAAALAKGGVRLTRLEFPQTEIQVYGATAFVYSTYEYDLEQNGSRTTHAGSATEIFVLRNGQWINPGWHLH